MVAWHHGNPPDKHARLHAWRVRVGASQFATCAIVELGFLRISMRVYGYDRQTAENALDLVKRDVTGYIDALPSPRLARWVLSHKQTTDAYLCQLARAHGMQLATFDHGIKDGAAFLIS